MPTNSGQQDHQIKRLGGFAGEQGTIGFGKRQIAGDDAIEAVRLLYYIAALFGAALLVQALGGGADDHEGIADFVGHHGHHPTEIPVRLGQKQLLFGVVEGALQKKKQQSEHESGRQRHDGRVGQIPFERGQRIEIVDRRLDT